MKLMDGTELDRDHYVNPWSRPFFITATWLLLVTVGLFFFYTLYIQWENTFIYYFASIFFGISYLAILYRGYGFLTQSYEIFVRDNEIEGKGLYGQRKIIRFDEIEKICEPPGFLISAVGIDIFKKNDLKFRIRVNSTIYKFGEMIERILEHSTDCAEINLGKLPENNSDWQKEPDWPLINRAIARAEENHRRRENENQ